MKIMIAALAAALALAANGAHAGNGFGSESEHRWSFEKDAEILVDPMADGLHVGCASFNPERVNFYIELLNEPAPGEFPVGIKQSGGHYTGGGRFHHVVGAKALQFLFYPGNRYRVRNETGTAVQGFHCDQGAAPGAPSIPATPRPQTLNR